MNIFFIEKTKKKIKCVHKDKLFLKSPRIYICSPHLAALVIRGKPREKINEYTSFNICLTARRPLGQVGGIV